MPSRHGQTIDLNKAEFEQLIQIDGIDDKRAELILTYRREHGPFHSWEEVRNVPGMGETMVERARDAATLGEEAAEAAETGEEEAEQGQEEMEAEEMVALLAIAQLDSEAAEAYAIAADSVSNTDLRKMLRGFEGDHRRHIEDLQKFMRDHGAKADVPPDGSSIVTIARAMGAIDPQASLEAIIGNELLTNAIYETALWVVTDEEAVAIVRRNREDEARHLQALQAWDEQHEDDED